MITYAHTATLPDGSPDPNRDHWQLLTNPDPANPGHLEAVAKLAAEFASAFHAAEWACLAGLWHDLGSFAREISRVSP
jgi:CRISPR-associated endonuclease/helicase Cas3